MGSGICARIGALVALWIAVAPAVGHAETVEEQLASLVAELPRTNPTTGRHIGEVVFLGTTLAPGLGELAKQYLLPRALNLTLLHSHVESALTGRYELADAFVAPEIEDDVEALRGFSQERASVAAVNRDLDVDAVIVARAELRPGLPGGVQVSLLLLAGRTEPGAFVQQGDLLLAEGLSPLGRWNGAAIAAVLLLVGLALRPVLRGAGSLEVQLPQQSAEPVDAEKSADGRARWNHAATSIHVKPRSQKGSGDKGRNDPRYSRSTMGGRTVFEKLPIGDYRVEARRVFRDPETSEVTCIQSEEKSVEIRRGRASQLRFELAEVQIPIEISVRDGKEPVTDGRAMAGLKGLADAGRYVRGGVTQLAAGRGEHEVVLGYEDRVYRRKVKLESASKRVTLEFDVSQREDVLFDACEAAVVPLVQGDREAAIQALDAAGQNECADLLRAELYQDSGRTSEAAEALESAGRVREAAELAAASDDTTRAATLFEQAGEHDRAAELYKSSGDLESAITAYENARDWDNAIACAFQTGDRTKAVELMEKKGAHFDAARMALEMREQDQAIRLLQRVSLHDPNYGESCITLTQLFAERNEPELALSKLDEAVDVFGADNFLELREQVADLLERKGELQLAIEALETIRKRDINFPGVAEKIEALRERTRGGAATTAGSSGGGPAGDSSSTAALEGRYEILGELGRGAMGIVFKAKDRRLGRVVALKRLPDSMKEHPTAVRLFLREARAAAALNHGNIVTLFDADQADDVYYLTMEYLDGMALDAILKKRTRLSTRDTLRLSEQIATGLAYAHSERIVHRDIKPANLFYTKQRQIKIMDFGLAKVVEEVRGASSVIGGTPYYMAPEQAVGDFVDHRADQYAFGVTMFQLITGRVPFDSGDVSYQHRHHTAPDVREFVAETPPGLASLIRRLMAKNAEERFESSNEIAKELGTLLREVEAELG